MMKRLLFAASVLICAVLVAAVNGDDETKKPPKKDKDPRPAKNIAAEVGMQIKLKLSKEILAGLATSDFEKIQESAKAMRSLNAIEHFARGGDDDYRTQLQVFQFSTRELVHTADEKNLEGATLAYTTMTTSCVACHKQLRKKEKKK